MAHFPPLYLTISHSITAPLRLRALRNIAADKGKADWREARDWTLENGAQAFGALAQGSNNDKPVWYNCTGPQFRDERYADEIEDSRIEHTGWFSDEACSRTLRGIVGRLPHGRFVAGYYSNDNGQRVYLPRVYADEVKAARAADDKAKREAEDEQEYNARWNAAQRKKDQADDEAKEIKRLYALRNHDALGDDARDEIGDHIAELRALRSSLKHEYSDIQF